LADAMSPRRFLFKIVRMNEFFIGCFGQNLRV
ncbi:MAG: hypothetical protein ACI81W_002662, partial [Saprospiraceae bacterium]